MPDGPPDDLPEDLPEELTEGRPDEGPILSPEELDITRSEYVEEIEEGRFVVSPHERPPQPAQESGDQSSRSPADTRESPEDVHATPQRESDRDDNSPQQPAQSSRQPPQPQPQSKASQFAPEATPANQQLTQERVHQWLRNDFERNSSRYAFDVTATFDGSVSQRRMASNDVVTIFESLMLWYAQQVDSNTPVEEILGILLMESNVPVRYPPESVKSLVKSTDLGPEDTIADLYEAIRDSGVQL